MGVCNCSMVCCTSMSILVCNHLDGEERTGCFVWFVLLVSRDCCVTLSRGAMSLSVVCDCGISRSYSLFSYNHNLERKIHIASSPNVYILQSSTFY